MSDNAFSALESLEINTRQDSLKDNRELIDYYTAVINGLSHSIINAYDNIPKNGIDNNYKLLNYLSASRSISISKSAIDIGLNGHPFEAFSLSRLLFELLQTTQYLTRHPELIARYYSGKIKPDQIRKQYEKEMPSNSSGRLFGLLSNFSHSTRDILLIPIRQYEEGVVTPVIINDKDLINKAIHSIVAHMWSHYFTFRVSFHDAKIADKTIQEMDAYIFDIPRMQRLFKNTSPELLQEMSENIIRLDGDER